MSKIARRVAFFIFSGLLITAVEAGENGHPTLNAIGRFWGVGYSQRGYQVAPGPLNILRQMQPASAYRSSSLLAPYHQASYPQAYILRAPNATAAPNSQSILQDNSESLAPPKPVGPPPVWLEPYLNDRSPEVKKTTEQRGEQPRITEKLQAEPAGELSPGDKDADELLLDLNSANRSSTPTVRANRYR